MLFKNAKRKNKFSHTCCRCGFEGRSKTTGKILGVYINKTVFCVQCLERHLIDLEIGVMEKNSDNEE